MVIVPFKGLIYMDRGVLKHAVLGRMRGEAALLALLRLPESQVVFKEGSFPQPPCQRHDPVGSIHGRSATGSEGSHDMSRSDSSLIRFSWSTGPRPGIPSPRGG